MRHRRALTSLGVLAVLAGLAAAGATGTPRAAACKAGMTTFAGANARTFCGPATATVKVAGKTLSFTGGSCERTATYLSLSIGTVVLGQTTKKKPDFFGIDVGAVPGTGLKPARKDGRYTGAEIAVESGGKGYLLRGDTAHVTLSGGRTGGSFTATVLFDTGSGSGTFHC